MKKISIIVPCYNEEEALPFFYEAITETLDALKNYTYEVILVDDGSKDKTAAVIKDLAAKSEAFKYVILSRNFGKESAMFAGLDNSTGDFVAVMDADLQDPPALIPEMLQAIESGEYDCVATRRVTRKGEPKIRSFFARRFYHLINKLSKTEIVDGARDYRLMTRTMVDAILEMKEYNRFSKGLFEWVGFRTKWLEYENRERVAGETKWSFWKLFGYSIEGIVAFSTKPLLLATFFGLLFCFLAFVGIILVIIRAIIDPNSAVEGWPSLICVILFVGGIQLSCMGIHGEYLAKTYMETKHRPIYIAKEKTTDKKSDK